MADRAAERLDRVFTLDITRDDPPLEPASLDCILFGDVLEHLVDPEAVLRRVRRFLAPDGVVIASIPNIQHHSVMTALLGGEFQYAPSGLLDATPLRFFTGSSILKLFLDAVYEPSLVDAIRLPCPGGLAEAARPLLEYLGLPPDRSVDELGIYQHIVSGRPMAEEPGPRSADEVPLSFVVCVSDERILAANLLASPCLGPGTSHELIAMRDAPNAAAGLNFGLERARHEWVVCVHQDVYLPRGWDRRVVQQCRLAERRFGEIGVAGVYGVGEVILPPMPGAMPAVGRIGRVVDRNHALRDGPELPAAVATLDELLLMVPRGSPLRFDPELGFHLYGADLCLQARSRGFAAVALEAPCLHRSRNVAVPESFYPAARSFTRKWAGRLPVATPCVLFGGDGSLFLLDGAGPEGGSLARPLGPPLIAGSSLETRGSAAGGGQEDHVRHDGSGANPPSSHPDPRERGLTSVIVPCFDQVEFTRHCLEALFRFTRLAWELIVVDNGSTDGTAAYLKSVQDATGVPVTAITNARNLGFPAAINQGLQVANGEYLVLLNNDAVVTDGWLDQLIALTRVRPENKTAASGGGGAEKGDSDCVEIRGSGNPISAENPGSQHIRPESFGQYKAPGFHHWFADVLGR